MSFLFIAQACGGDDDSLSDDEKNAIYENDMPRLFTPMSAAMWNDVEAQGNAWGDPNNCQAKVRAIPSDGMVLEPCDGSCIQDALDSNPTVRLQPGIYNISSTLNISGKNLIGNGEGVEIRAGDVDTGMTVISGSTVSNVKIIGAANIGVALFGSSNNLIHQVSVSRTGRSSVSNGIGRGFQIFESDNNCIVSSQATESFNEDGNGCGTCEQGGNADGFTLNFESENNSIINTYSVKNADEGFDFWEGGTAYIYLSEARENGTLVERPLEDGNGFELGRGSAEHFLYKTQSNNNNANGFDQNGNTIPSVLKQCTATGNGQIDFAGVTNDS